MRALGYGLGLPWRRQTGEWVPPNGNALVQWLKTAPNGVWLPDSKGTGTARTPQSGRCYTLDGVNDYVTIPDFEETGGAGENLSVSMWVKGSPQNSNVIASHYESVSGNQRSWWLSSGRSANSAADSIEVVLCGNGSSTYKIYDVAGVTVFDNTWHHVAFTWNAGTLKLFVDGVEETPNKVADASFTAIHNSTAAVMLGAQDPSNPSRHFTGSVFDARIYAKTLSADEISFVHSFGAIGTDPTIADCKAWYKCDEKQGTVAYDSSGNGNDGTATNVTISSFHDTQDVYSWHNEVGYTDSGAPWNVFYPRNESDPENDVLGNPLGYSGRVALDAKLVESHAVTFGASGYVKVDHDDLLNLTGNMTAAVWVKGAWSGNKVMMEKKASDSLMLQPLYASQFHYYDLGNPCTNSGISTDILDNEWHHLAFTYDGTQKHLYLDGVLQHSATVSAVAANTDPFMVGSRFGAYGFDGLMADVRLYETDLSADEMLYLATGGVQGTDAGTDDLVLCWPMVEGYGQDGTQIHDVSGNDLHGGMWGVGAGSPWANTQNVFAYNANYGFRLSGSSYIPALLDGSAAADGNPITNPVGLLNGCESGIDHDPYGVPALAAANLDSMVLPDPHDFGDASPDAFQYFFRATATNEDRFIIYREALSGADLARTQSYTS